MQMLETLRLVVMVMVRWSHRRTHGVVAVLMMRRASPMRMILGGMMLMRMIGGRQKARRGRVNAGAVAGRPAERCCGTINKRHSMKKYAVSKCRDSTSKVIWNFSFVSYLKFSF